MPLDQYFIQKELNELLILPMGPKSNNTCHVRLFIFDQTTKKNYSSFMDVSKNMKDKYQFVFQFNSVFSYAVRILMCNE